MKKILAMVFATACVAIAPPTFASGSQWTALVAYDDDSLAPQMLPIAADSEEACLAAVSSHRVAQVIEPCQPTASAITDPNDANRTSKTPRPRTEPRDAGRVLGDLGHIGGG
jgi:hypothetical protein